MEHSPLIAIAGPTGSGKTELGLQLAKRFGGEIIGADSRQVYTEIDIASDKPSGRWSTRGDQRLYLVDEIPYHLVDIIPPDQEFTLSDYIDKATTTIKEIRYRNAVPFIVGGTGLYLDALLYNLQLPQVPPNPILRKKLAHLPVSELRQTLGRLDPSSESRIADTRRLIRAIEIVTSTGKPISYSPRYSSRPAGMILGLDRPKDLLYPRIDQRIEQMFTSGLVEETRRLMAKYDVTLPALSSLGYAEIAACFDSNLPLEEAKQHLKIATRRYAKRQMTWAARNPHIHWISGLEDASAQIEKYLGVKVKT